MPRNRYIMRWNGSPEPYGFGESAALYLHILLHRLEPVSESLAGCGALTGLALAVRLLVRAHYLLELLKNIKEFR